MKHPSPKRTLASAVLLAGLLSSLGFRDAPRNFVSVFVDPKGNLCHHDFVPAKKGGETDAGDEAQAGQNASGGKLGDFRGIRPEHVAKVQGIDGCGFIKFEIEK